MIDLRKPEPDHRECAGCLKTGPTAALRGVLIHWPSETAVKPVHFYPGDRGEGIEPFSLWLYTCRWCRGWDTRRKRR